MRIAVRTLALAVCAVAVAGVFGCGSRDSASVKPTKPVRPVASKSAVDAEESPVSKPSTTAPQAPKPTAAALLKQLQKTYKAMSSLEVEEVRRTAVSADGKPVGKPVSEKTSIVFSRPNKMVVQTSAMGVTVDGTNVYNYSPTAKQYTKSPIGPDFVKSLTVGKPGVGVMGLLYGIDYTKAVVAPKMLPDARIGGRDVSVVTFGLKEGAGVPKGVTGKQTLWIGKADMGVYRNRLTISIDTTKLSPRPKTASGKDAKVITTTTTNEQTVYRPNTKIPDAAFTFRPPPGARAIKQRNPTGLVDQSAPDFSYTAQDGTTRKLSDLKGKFVVLDFWALPMCESHLPVLQSLSKDPRSDTELLAINLNRDKAAVMEYLRKKGDTFSVVFADAEIARVAGEKYGLRALPTILILDKNGIVRAQFLGPTTEKQIGDRLNSIRSGG